MGQYIINALKGALMGAANVIPGVSGGTMALLTGVFEKLILSIKSFDTKAIKLACTFQFKALFEYVNFYFLLSIGIGAVVSVLTFAKVLEYLFEEHSLYVWSFFFGLIFASVYYVGQKIKKYTGTVFTFFVIGTVIAASLVFLEPATENASIPYLLLCGAVAMCSMILPGLSGSYMLLLMGNYQLVMIKSVSNFDLAVLIPVGIGALIGLLLFARILAWIFKKFHDQTLALLTGFIFGSLAILWPWKTAVIQLFGDKEKVVSYSYTTPDMSLETVIALILMVIGVLSIVAVERLAATKKVSA